MVAENEDVYVFPHLNLKYVQAQTCISCFLVVYTVHGILYKPDSSGVRRPRRIAVVSNTAGPLAPASTGYNSSFPPLLPTSSPCLRAP